MRPAQRCRAYGCLPFVVHASGRLNPCVRRCAAISYIKDLLAI